MTNSRRFLTMLALAMPLAASTCLQDDGLTSVLEGDPTKDLLTACGTINGAVSILTVNKAKLSADQIAVIDKVVDQYEPVCGADEPPVSRLDLIERLALQVSSIEIGG